MKKQVHTEHRFTFTIQKKTSKQQEQEIEKFVKKNNNFPFKTLPLPQKKTIHNLFLVINFVLFIIKWKENKWKKREIIALKVNNNFVTRTLQSVVRSCIKSTCCTIKKKKKLKKKKINKRYFMEINTENWVRKKT